MPLNHDLHAEHGGASFEAIGVDFSRLESRNRIVNADVLDAWYDPAPGVLEAIREDLSWLIRTSPPTQGEGLASAISVARRIPREQILVGAGTSSLMYLAFRHLVPKGGRIVIPDPTYGEYPHLARNVLEADLTRVPARRDWTADLDRLSQAAAGANLVVLVNPNSPTGKHASIDLIEAFMRTLSPATRVWLDETYVDFTQGASSAERFVEHYPNLIVSKSMSKYYALSGLRVGYLVLDPELRGIVERDSPPWPVGLLGQLAAVAALKSHDYYAQRAIDTAALRAEFAAQIDTIPSLQTIPSSTNFLLVESKERLVTEPLAQMRRAGEFVRDCSSISELFEGRFFRTAVKDPESNRRIVGALKLAFA